MDRHSKEQRHKNMQAVNISSNLVRKCIKYFRRYVAVTCIDFLSLQEVQDIIFKYLSEDS